MSSSPLTSPKPRELRSDEQPDATLCTTSEMVSLEHAGREQRPVSQVLIVGTIEVLLFEIARLTRAEGFKQDASLLPTIDARVVWHWEESLRSGAGQQGQARGRNAGARWES